MEGLRATGASPLFYVAWAALRGIEPPRAAETDLTVDTSHRASAPARSHRGRAVARRARYASTGAAHGRIAPSLRHGSLAGVAMPSHRRRSRCASRRADRPSGRRNGTARSHHGDPVGSPVRYASRAGDRDLVARTAPARSHRGRAVARRARYASTGAAHGRVAPSHRHGSLAGVAMPLHRRRCRYASRRADRPSGRRSGTARSHHGDPVGSPVRYASRAGAGDLVAPTAPARSHRGRAVARRARYASTGAVHGRVAPSHRHGSLAGVAMPLHRRRCRCASRRADRPSGCRTGTARSHRGRAVGSPVRYASRAAPTSRLERTSYRTLTGRARSYGPTLP